MGPGLDAERSDDGEQTSGQTRLRDSTSRNDRPLAAADCQRIGIDVDGHRVFADGKEIQLARKEYDLLHTLIEHAGRTLSRREILDSVWGDGYVDRNKTLDVHIRRLRRKIDPGSASPRIRTVRGIGYVLDVDASQLTRMR